MPVSVMQSEANDNSGYESNGSDASVDNGIYCDDFSCEDSLSDQEGCLTFPKREENPKLPKKVTVLEGEHGSKVYLIGTKHYSKRSQKHVEETIKKTQPNVVVLELCQNRLDILSLDEETYLEESKSLSVDKFRRSIKELGMVQGTMYMSMFSLSAQLTKKRGMAPGGEFRRAFKQALKVPGCIVHLGDRPVYITLRRALSSLSVWQKIKLAWGKTGKCSASYKVFIDERDIYLTYSLQLAASPIPDVSRDNTNIFQPAVVVGVVGIDHVPGIVKHWLKVADADIPPLMTLPKKGMASIILGKGLKYSILSLIAYGCYRCLVPTTVSYLIGDF